MIKVNTSPRRNNFTIAAGAGKLIRQAFDAYLHAFMDPSITQKMMKVLMQVLKSSTSTTGNTHLAEANLNLLNRFSFNSKADLHNVFGERFAVLINRDAGEVTLEVPGFNPLFSFFRMNCGTHFKLICAVAELDFENNLFETVNLPGKFIRTDLNEVITSIHQVEKIKAGSALPFIAVLGIQFFTQQGNQMYPLKNATLTPLEIVLVDERRGERKL